MNEKPTLVMNVWLRGEPPAYECLICGQRFLLPEGRSPKEAAKDVWSAFREHVRENHPEDVDPLRAR
jgi:hypothetical protein